MRWCVVLFFFFFFFLVIFFLPTSEIHDTCICIFWNQTKFSIHKVWWLRETSQIGQNHMWKNSSMQIHPAILDVIGHSKKKELKMSTRGSAATHAETRNRRLFWGPEVDNDIKHSWQTNKNRRLSSFESSVSSLSNCTESRTAKHNNMTYIRFQESNAKLSKFKLQAKAKITSLNNQVTEMKKGASGAEGQEDTTSSKVRHW